MNGSHDRRALGPENDTGPKPLAAVCSSEICRRGLCRVTRLIAVSKFAGSARTRLGAERSVAVWAVQRYHQAMSCGFTSDTVVHHGRLEGILASHRPNCAAISGSARQPSPGPPFGDG